MFESYTTEELKNEIKKREILENEKPKIIKNPDLSEIIDCLEDYMEYLVEGNVDDDYKQWIYEAVVETFYGKDVWKFINNRT